jgi:hypothetical protein
MVRRVRAPVGHALVVIAAVAALASALLGGWYAARKLDDWRTTYGELPPGIRDDPVALFLGYDDATWEELGRVLGRGDRYAVVASGEGRFEVSNYAAYRLLPAIEVPRAQDADVVVHFRPAAAPPGCAPVGKDACIVRRETP